MTIRQQLWISLLGIIVLTVLAGIIAYPNGPDITWKGNLVREVKVHLGLDLQGGTSLVYQADVSGIPVDAQADAMAGVRDVLERRINAFGVSEPVIQTNRAGDDWRVIIELPGISDINKAVEQIGETPLLEFKVEGDPTAQIESIRQLNEQNKQTAQDIFNRVMAGEDFAIVASAESQDTGSAERGGELGYFGKGIMVQPFEDAAFNGTPGQVVPQLIESDYGYHIIKVEDKTTGVAKDLNAQLGIEDATTSPDQQLTEAQELVKASHILIQKYPEDPALLGPVYDNTDLTGKDLKRASVQFDQTTSFPVVALQFNSEGADLFETITKEHIGETIAIYLDGEIISAPVVNQVISGGEAQISGDFDIQEARSLVERLNAGALPVKINLINQRNIGPTLGEQAIQDSVLAGMFGIILLAIFMVGYYRLPGVIAVVALGVYGLILLAIFKLWPITLTLSGIAGFIMSLGIAVDANVLIFERLKEELRNGKSLHTAIDDGFKRAWSSIRDSNVSSLITCLVLIWFGTSFVKGFAITLALGIVLSMFTAITFTRAILKLLPFKHHWLYGLKSFKASDMAKGSTKIFNIVGHRKLWYTVSAILVTISLAAWSQFGLNLGIDFTGGSLLQVKYPTTSPSVADITNQLAPLNLGGTTIQASNDNTVLIRTQFLDNTQRQAVLDALGNGVTEESFESVGPTVGEELRTKSVTALVLVVIIIVIYMAIVFRKVSKGPVPSWAYGVSAIIALLHDIIMIIGVFVILGKYFGVEINSMFITALLTILGFSINDTIVVFDRIREGLRRSKEATFEGVMNESINQTIMRSLNTSNTVLIVLGALLLFGGSSIFYFVLALMIGIITGTYSSIFIASPLLLFWQKVLKKK